jgi:hypothetical protein
MPNDSVPAAAPGSPSPMPPTSEPSITPRQIEETLKRLDLVDHIHEISCFVDCAYFAAMKIGNFDESNALCTVLGHASAQLRELGEKIHARHGDVKSEQT